ncbi:MAG TPA: Na(+)/H(+) antiporter subunit D [Candidatus Acidoferrales bacterium]|nr:Na(+)/H(+) antiporter subunit D [Candidatus Acidoferrales bacterium]
MSAEFPPGLILIVGAAFVPLLRTSWRNAYLLLLPLLSLAHLLALPHGAYGQIGIFDYILTPVRVDKLSLVFGIVFHLAVFLSALYALHEDNVQHVAGFVYAGSAIGAVFAGDLITLFVFWEIAAVSSVFLIWARRTESAYRAGLRYLAVQVTSGLLLLAGIILRAAETGDIAFDFLGLNGLAHSLIFVAFGIKCAFPLLHNWLQDAYPEATVGGTVFLSAFTTKLAVYALARGFPGTEMLVWIGATMTAFPIFYAVIENDLRRVLAYSLNNQLGFMVVGIGVGTELALNGTAAHAFTHIIYKALLFMSMGAVLYRTGTINGSDLGGLYKSMPYTTLFCIVGAASISAFPLFGGFISKSLIISATADQSYVLTWWVLLFASAGVFHHSGIKIPFFAFFAHDSGIRCKEAPQNMLFAMGAAAVLCVGLGIWPEPLYRLLPFAVDYAPYTWTHVITQLQLLLFSALAFAVLKRTGIYPPELRAINLDSDWLYRRLPKLVWSWGIMPMVRRVNGYRDAARARVASIGHVIPEIRGASLLALYVVLLLFCLLVVSFWQAERL